MIRTTEKYLQDGASVVDELIREGIIEHGVKPVVHVLHTYKYILIPGMRIRKQTLSVWKCKEPVL